jgi:hypothetical protein
MQVASWKEGGKKLQERITQLTAQCEELIKERNDRSQLGFSSTGDTTARPS